MRRAAFAFLVVGLLAATGAAGNPGGKAGEKDEDKVQGSWSVVSGEKEGKKVPEGEFKDFRVTFGAGGKLTASHDGKDVEATYKLDPAKKPRQIDVTISEGGMDQLFKGIYALEKDTLKLCLAHPPEERPTEFATQEGVRSMLLVLKRDKK
jgi:uncharacterized protein (TIGR03067 family)